jgi:K+-transporting ATPase ATPase C chain
MAMRIFYPAIRPTLVGLCFFSILLGVFYPAFSTVLIRTFFAKEADASLITKSEEENFGSKYIGQSFSKHEYFWGRISATSTNPYDASASKGSNFSVHNPELLEQAKKRIAALKEADPENNLQIPVDLVTASASGLDPHISLAAAEYQVARIAKQRKISADQVRKIIERATISRQFGIFGEPCVNVLEANLALDGKI